MPEADGYVRINAQFDDSRLTRQLASLGQKFNRQIVQLEKAKASVEQLEAAFESLTSGKTTPKSIIQMEKEIANAEKSVAKLQREFDAVNDSIETKSANNPTGVYDEEIRQLTEQSIEIGARLDEAKAHVEALKKSLAELKADPTKTKEAQDVARQLGLAREEVDRLSADLNNTNEAMQSLKKQTTGTGVEMEKTVKKAGGLEKMLKSMARRMLLLYAIRGVFTYIRNAIMSLSGIGVLTNVFSDFNNRMRQAYQNNEELQASLANLRGALYTAFQPIYSAVVPALVSLANWLARCISYIGAFFSGLSGKTLADSAKSAKNLAKAVGGVGGAAKQANKQLASFDKLNNLSAESGGGGGGGGGADATFDPPENENLSKWQEWGEKLKAIIDGIREAFQALSDWWNSASPEERLLTLTPIIIGLIGALGLLLGWPAMIIVALVALGVYVETFYDQISGWLTNAYNTVHNFFLTVVDTITGAVANITDRLRGGQSMWSGILSAIISVVSGAVLAVWHTVQGVVELIINIVNAVVETIHAIATGDWSKAWEAWGKVLFDFAISMFNVVIDVVNAIIGVFEGLVNSILGGIDAVLKGISGILNFFGLGTDWGVTFRANFGRIPTVAFAEGGFPDVGSLFLAGEAGPELVGSFGSHNNTVVNEAQLVDAFRQASSEQVSLMQQQNSLLAAILNKELTFKPSSAAGKVFSQSIGMYNKAMGV